MVKEYSLWIVPSGSVYDKLASVISRLSEQYSTPNLEPHVTLLGDLALSEESMLSKTSALANLIRPFTIKLTTVSYSDEFFRCLFVKVDESEDLMKANLRARMVLNRQQEPKYMPHLSLMYGNLTPETKESIISEIGSDFDMEFEAKSIDLVLSSSKLDPNNWRRLKRFTLRQSYP